MINAVRNKTRLNCACKMLYFANGNNGILLAFWAKNYLFAKIIFFCPGQFNTVNLLFKFYLLIFFNFITYEYIDYIEDFYFLFDNKSYSVLYTTSLNLLRPIYIFRVHDVCTYIYMHISINITRILQSWTRWNNIARRSSITPTIEKSAAIKTAVIMR